MEQYQINRGMYRLDSYVFPMVEVSNVEGMLKVREKVSGGSEDTFFI